MDDMITSACNWLVCHHRVAALLTIGSAWAASAYSGLPI